MRAAEIRRAKERRQAVRRPTVRLALLGLAYVLFIQCTGVGIPCLFRPTTGYRYPGCGMTHAATALSYEQPRTAWQENPLSFTVVSLLVFHGIYHAEVCIRTTCTDFKGREILFFGVLWTVALLLWLLRNLQTSL